MMNLSLQLKPTHMEQYLHFQSNHPLHVKQGTVQTLYNRVLTNCQEQSKRSIESKT